MHSLFICFLLCQSSVEMLDRDSFSMTFPAKTINRLKDDKHLIEKIINKSRELINSHSDLIPTKRADIVSYEVSNWLYQNNLIDSNLDLFEKLELDKIVTNELYLIVSAEIDTKLDDLRVAKVKTSAKKKQSTSTKKKQSTSTKKKQPLISVSSPMKYWFWSSYNNTGILLYGWTDPTTGQKVYDPNEQLPEVKDVLRGRSSSTVQSYTPLSYRNGTYSSCYTTA